MHVSHNTEELMGRVEQLENVALELRDALTACEENLRLVHDAIGPVPRSTPMPKYSTFSAWKLANKALENAKAVL